MTAKTKKVRVLVDQPGHAINDTPELTEAEAEAAVKAGWADADPAAVAYAESLAPPAAKATEAPAS
jgi:hypothetical protein